MHTPEPIAPLGAFSAHREHLRIERGRHAFDICAAPFGSGFFVSWWLSRKRPSLLLALIFLGVLFLGLLLASGSLLIAVDTAQPIGTVLEQAQRDPGTALMAAWASDRSFAARLDCLSRLTTGDAAPS